MFNVGGGEFLIIALIALIVLGPTRLPDAARQIGKVMGEVRRVSSGFQNELRGAMNDPTGTGPARDVLAADPAAPADGTVAQRPRRATPLKAAPAKKATPASKAAKPRSKRS